MYSARVDLQRITDNEPNFEKVFRLFYTAVLQTAKEKGVTPSKMGKYYGCYIKREAKHREHGPEIINLQQAKELALAKGIIDKRDRFTHNNTTT